MATVAETHTRHSKQVVDHRSRGAALALVYVAIWVALWHASSRLNLTAGVDLWYPPAGLTFAILLEYGARALPFPIVASLIAGVSLWPGEQWPYYLLANLIMPLSYAAAAHVLRHYFAGRRHEKWHFNDPRRVALFLAAAAAGSLLAALSGVAVLWSAGLPLEPSPPEIVLGWWIGDFIGVATLAPLALIFVAPLAWQFRWGEPPHLTESRGLADPLAARLALLQTVLSALLLLALFWIPHRFWPDQPQPFLSLLLLPVLAWIAATHDMRGTVLTLFLYELGIVAMVMWFGQADQTLQYQIVMLAMGISGLLTGAVSQARLAHIAGFRALAEASNDLLWEFDARGRLRDLGGRLAKTVEWHKDHRDTGWRAYVVQQEQDTDFAALETAIRQRRPFQQLVLRLRLPGRDQSVWTLNSGSPLFDDGGGFLGYRGATTDITDHKKAEALQRQAEALLRDYDQKLEAEVVERTRTLAEASQRNWRLANFDSLTGLPNRNLFFEHLRKGLQQARRQWRLAALLLVDLDGFKQVNDTFGHDAGDELLRRIADRLQQCVRATDIAARLGGDEFTVILLNLEQPRAAEAVARKIVERLAEPVPLGEASATVTASVGIALYRPEWPDTLDLAMTLLRQADAAMYAAKHAGKNAWRFAEPTGPD
ncbi:MAG: diguanylate cyclase [Candidatus Contendobacter sp.]